MPAWTAKRVLQKSLKSGKAETPRSWSVWGVSTGACLAGARSSIHHSVCVRERFTRSFSERPFAGMIVCTRASRKGSSILWADHAFYGQQPILGQSLSRDASSSVWQYVRYCREAGEVAVRVVALFVEPFRFPGREPSLVNQWKARTHRSVVIEYFFGSSIEAEGTRAVRRPEDAAN
jgi:hypothetical protein